MFKDLKFLEYKVEENEEINCRVLFGENKVEGIFKVFKNDEFGVLHVIIGEINKNNNCGVLLGELESYYFNDFDIEEYIFNYLSENGLNISYFNEEVVKPYEMTNCGIFYNNKDKKDKIMLSYIFEY